MAAITTSIRVAERAASTTWALRLAALPALVAAATFWLAYDGGSYATTAWTSVAIVVWWLILLLVAFDVAPTERLRSGTGAVAGLLAAFTALALASVLWADGNESAVIAFDRDALYLGVFVLVVLLSSRATLSLWSDGLGLAVAAIAVVALASRLHPTLFGAQALPELLPTAGARLSFPLGYWNGLAIFLGVGAPLLLRAAASSARPVAVRAIALGALPLCAAALYLTSSRGGVATAAVGALLLIVLAGTWSALGAALVAAAGSLVAIAVLRGQSVLVDGPLGSATATSEGRTAAYLLLLTAVATGSVFVLAVSLLRDRRQPDRRTALLIAGAAVVAAGVAVGLAHPVRRFDEFKALPAATAGGQTVVGAHLASGSGSGRWQFWSAAVDEFESAPWVGRGAGSFETWWTQHASFSYFIRDAHSLYLETLGELGAVGLVLLVAAFATGLALGGRALARSRDDERLGVAAVIAAFGAYLVGAGVDWMWKLPAVSILGIACLALVAGPAVDRPQLVRVEDPARVRARSSIRGRFGLGIAILAVCWFVLAAQASSLLSGEQLHRSQQLASSGDLAASQTAARDAHQIAPWSAQPLVQLALVEEQAGRLGPAHASIVGALDQDPLNWRLWLIRVRLEVERGDVPAARQSLAKAKELDPLSPLLRG